MQQLQELGLAADARSTRRATRCRPARSSAPTRPPARSSTPARPSPCTCRPGERPVTVPDVRNKPLDAAAKADLTAAGPDARHRAPATNSPSVAAGTVHRHRRPRPARTDRGRARPSTSSSRAGCVDAHRRHRPDARRRRRSYLAAENLQLTPVPKPDPACKSQPGSPVTAAVAPARRRAAEVRGRAHLLRGLSPERLARPGVSGSCAPAGSGAPRARAPPAARRPRASCRACGSRPR